ncbi:MAG: translational GTPase TypA [Anaplasmataceae bacterium]|nr:translational GTPase TypA [Anaplasmataceae bacterium]
MTEYYGDIYNIAIIAHVDHGKTTLIDNLLKQTDSLGRKDDNATCLMDKNPLEKEKGITIQSKCTSIKWKEKKINIIDTPGHADFGGEVERILSMTECVLLLVDSAEGPMPQTQFVLSKALKIGLNPILVINKVDKPNSDPDNALNLTFELFCNLGATEKQLDFPVLYASGRDGWCTEDLEKKSDNLNPMFDMIMKHVPKASSPKDDPAKVLVTMIEGNKFLGKILVGKIHSGTVKTGASVHSLNLKNEVIEKGRISKLMTFNGMDRVIVSEAIAGDIVIIAGLEKTSVSDTVCDTSVTEGIPSTPIDPPTISITVGVNDSPLAGKEGSKLTSNMIKERLYEEAESNVAISIETAGGTRDAFELKGRGELQLGVIIETMRREGFELSISKPKVIFQYDDDNKKLEPVEEVFIDIEEEFSGIVMEKINHRKGEMLNMQPSGGTRTKLHYLIPSRGMIGYQGEFMTDTRGSGIMNRIFHSYQPYKGKISGRLNGVLVATDKGAAVGYALFNIQGRGTLFVAPGEEVYCGMIVGQHSRDNDLDVNVQKGKQLTNVRASGTDEAIKLTTPKSMTLEDMMAYIESDEMLEVTPKSLRLRKLYLLPADRKKYKRSAE